MNTEERILTVIARIFKKNTNELLSSTLFKEDLKAKSMNFMEMSAMLENEFQIDIPMRVVSKAKSIKDIFDIIADITNVTQE